MKKNRIKMTATMTMKETAMAEAAAAEAAVEVVRRLRGSTGGVSDERDICHE